MSCCFLSVQAREHFCQLVQLIRNRMKAGTGTEQDSVSIFVGTWNMGMVWRRGMETRYLTNIHVSVQLIRALLPISPPGFARRAWGRHYLMHWLNHTTYMLLEHR